MQHHRPHGHLPLIALALLIALGLGLSAGDGCGDTWDRWRFDGARLVPIPCDAPWPGDDRLPAPTPEPLPPLAYPVFLPQITS